MKRNLYILLFFVFCFHVFMKAQPSYNNCANALKLCPNTTYSATNIDANSTLCTNCEDDFNYCFSGENTVWFTFTTNDSGGVVTIDFTQIVFQNNPGQGNALQATVIQADLPCISSSYTNVATCESNGTAPFSLTTNPLAANTTYYIVVNGNKGATLNAEATFDIAINGKGVERNSTFSIGTDKTTICKGEMVVMYAKLTLCDTQSVVNWYIDGNFAGSVNDTLFTYADFTKNSTVTATTICYEQCVDSFTSNPINFTVLDFLVDAGEDVTIQQGESIQLEGETTESTISWTPDSYINNSSILDPIVYPEKTTTYYLTVSNGTCSITDEVTVVVEEGLTIPNTFTPNGDAINDTWEILGIEQYPNCFVQVFTRWGQLVFQSTGYSLDKRWDGTTEYGRKATSGTYYYVIKLRDEQQSKPIKGTLSLVR